MAIMAVTMPLTAPTTQVLGEAKNRTVAEIKSILSRFGGSLGGPGSTSYIFVGESKEPSFTVQVAGSDVEKVTKLVTELNAQDDVQEVFTNHELI